LGEVASIQVEKTPAMTLVEATAEKPADDVDYAKYDRPTVQRHAPKEERAVGARTANGDFDLEYLDIPAFLRKQAD
jgi:cell division protein FtsZ